MFLIPDLIIGDLDSINSKTLDRAKKDAAEIISYEIDKDKTDFELALNYLKINNYKNITIIGGESGELDHLFGNLLAISAFHTKEYIEWKQSDKNIIFSDRYYFLIVESRAGSCYRGIGNTPSIPIPRYPDSL